MSIRKSIGREDAIAMPSYRRLNCGASAKHLTYSLYPCFRRTSFMAWENSTLHKETECRLERGIAELDLVQVTPRRAASRTHAGLNQYWHLEMTMFLSCQVSCVCTNPAPQHQVLFHAGSILQIIGSDGNLRMLAAPSHQFAVASDVLREIIEQEQEAVPALNVCALVSINVTCCSGILSTISFHFDLSKSLQTNKPSKKTIESICPMAMTTYDHNNPPR